MIDFKNAEAIAEALTCRANTLDCHSKAAPALADYYGSWANGRHLRKVVMEDEPIGNAIFEVPSELRDMVAQYAMEVADGLKATTDVFEAVCSAADVAWSNRVDGGPQVAEWSVKVIFGGAAIICTPKLLCERTEVLGQDE